MEPKFKVGDIIKATDHAYAAHIGNVGGRLYRIIKIIPGQESLVLNTPLPNWRASYFDLATEEDLAKLNDIEKEFL